MNYPYYECHCHIALDGIDFKEAAARHKNGADTAYLRSVLERYKSVGITYIRDGGDKWGASEATAKIADEYGIEYVTPVFPIFKKGNYGGFLGRGFESLSEYRALVAEAKSKGADFIKIMASGIMNFDVFGELTGFILKEAELAEMVKISHGEGMPVMVHVNSADGIKRTVAAGADSVEHGNYTDDSALSDMASAGCVWTPTIAATADLIGLGLFDEGMLSRILALQKENLKKGADMGVIIAPGSDAGTKGVMHCKGLSDEISIITKVLGSDAEILRGQEKIRSVFSRKG